MDLLRPLLVVTVLASFAAACGTVSVEVTSGSDDGKIDVDRSPGLEPESVSAPGQPPGSSTTSAPLGLLGEGSETTSTSSSTTSVPATTLPATSVPTSTTSAAPVVETTTTLASTTTTVAPTIPLEYHQIDYAVFAWLVIPGPDAGQPVRDRRLPRIRPRRRIQLRCRPSTTGPRSPRGRGTGSHRGRHRRAGR